MAKQWYVVHTKPQNEVLASSLLAERLQVTVYLPEVRQQRRGKLQAAPLFPGYLFVQMDSGQTEASAVNAVPGVLRLVAFGGHPQSVPAPVMDALMQRVAAFDQAGGLPQHPFHAGDPVRLTDGPLAGLEAAFVGPMRPSERVRVLLTFLGQLQEVEVPVAMLEAAQRPRRTRGKGRWITSSSDHTMAK